MSDRQHQWLPELSAQMGDSYDVNRTACGGSGNLVGPGGVELSMKNPSELYHWVEHPDDSQPGVLLMAVEGFMDAGHTVRMLADHLIETGQPTEIVNFDTDQLIDYRGRRPGMVFDTDHFESYQRPELTMYRLTDRDGKVYYLLHGLEPDYQWERVIAAIMDINATLGITRTITWHGIPMGVPHTRPSSYTTHSTDPALCGDRPSVFGRVHIPAGFASLLQLRLGEAGEKAMGFALHVPHYLAEAHHPESALNALNAISDAADLNLPNDALVAGMSTGRAELSKALSEQPEIAELVRQMEEHYDQAIQTPEARGLLPGSGSQLPSADELGADFEQFLRDVSDDGS